MSGGRGVLTTWRGGQPEEGEREAWRCSTQHSCHGDGGLGAAAAGVGQLRGQGRGDL